MDAETPTGTSDGEALSVDDLVALVRRLEQTIAELQVENARLKRQLADRDGQHPTQRLEAEDSLEAEDKRSGRPATEYQIDVSFESVRITHALGLRHRWDDGFRMHGPE
jgi:hypothetical protein